MSERVKIGYGQFLPIFGDLDGNRARMAEVIRNAKQADLLVLPELATSGYEFLDRDELARLAEPFLEGETSQLLLKLAAETDTVLVAGYAERAGEQFFNSSMLATPDGKLENYRKIHLFHREKELFAPGDAVPTVVETKAGRIGQMICFDWSFPETARLIALAGGQIIAHPSNLVMPWCQRAMFTRCLENSVYAVTANRIGTEERVGRVLTFTGQSQVTGPRGETLLSAPIDSEETKIVEVDLEMADEKRYNELNHRYEDRRVELYGALLGPYDA